MSKVCSRIILVFGVYAVTDDDIRGEFPVGGEHTAVRDRKVSLKGVSPVTAALGTNSFSLLVLIMVT